MSAVAVARSALLTDLARYRRSWGLWLLLLVAPVGARFMVATDDGSGIQIAVGGHLPVMTSAVLGVSLGIVVTTLLLPIGFIYLRSNTTRRQPWQIEEVTAAMRTAICIGHFLADVAVLFAMLAALTVAGWFLGWLILPGPPDIGQITLGLWIVAAPPLMGLAALRQLLSAIPFTRGGFGDFCFFVLWMTSIIMPVAAAGRPSSLATNMYDFPGFVRPLIGAAILDEAADFSIGGGDIKPGRVPLDVMAGVSASGYVVSRLVWAALAVLVAAFAGLVYRPHTQRGGKRRWAAFARYLDPGAPPPANPDTPAAHRTRFLFGTLIATEFRLIGNGRLFLLLAAGAAILSLFGDFRHMGSPAALLLLIFGMTAHAGRSEARGLLALTGTMVQPPLLRRAAFILAGIGWAAILALPAALIALSPQPLLLAIVTGTTVAMIAICLSTVSHSAFASRLVLLILWYGYLSMK